MKHLLSIFSIAMLCIASCKSDDTPDMKPSTALSGYFYAFRQLDPDSPAIRYSEQATAFLTTHPGDTTHYAVDSVLINGTQTTLDNAALIYKASAGVAPALRLQNGCSWQVFCTGNIPSFSYNYSEPFPDNNYYTLPDTANRTTSFSIGLPIGADSILVTLTGNTQVTRILAGSPSGVGFSPSELGQFSAGNALLRVSAYRSVTKEFGGKNFRFVKQTSREKMVLLK